MNRLTIIGNLTRNPELRTTQNGKSVCSFTVAVNRMGKSNEADYFSVSAWGQLGENCQKYLSKGRKVCVVGAVGVHTYKKQDGTTAASLDLQASEVEFLTPRTAEESSSEPSQMTDVTAEVADDLPF